MTFSDYTKDLVEPYILAEITRQMQDAQSHLLNLAEEHQYAFETEIIENANCWIEYQRKNFRQLAMSDQMILKRVKALEQASAQGNSIDTANKLRRIAAPALPLAIEPPSHYASEGAACMINEKYQPWLNEVGRQFIAPQEQLAQLQKQVAKAHERRSPLAVAFGLVVRSQGTTPSVKNLRPSSPAVVVSKSSSISSGKSSRQNSPQVSPPECIPFNPFSLTTIVHCTSPSGSRTKYAGDMYRTRTTLWGSRANPFTHHSTSPRSLCFGSRTTRASNFFGECCTSWLCLKGRGASAYGCLFP